MQIRAYIQHRTVHGLHRQQELPTLIFHLRKDGIPAFIGEDGQPTVLPEHGILKRGIDLTDAYCFIFEGCGPIYGR